MCEIQFFKLSLSNNNKPLQSSQERVLLNHKQLKRVFTVHRSSIFSPHVNELQRLLQMMMDDDDDDDDNSTF